MADIKELDILISQYALEHTVIRLKKGGYREKTRQGTIRPLRAYSADISAAWEVVQRMKMMVIPVADGQWFSLVGPDNGWADPAEMLGYLQRADFTGGGAAVSQSAPLSICLAALKALQKRKNLNFEALSEFQVPVRAEMLG